MIELECLAVVWGCDKVKNYLLGLPHFLVETDHKPLVPILTSKNLDQLSPRLQRMRMKLLAFNFSVVWIPGKLNYAADALSRAPVRKADNEEEIAEQAVRLHLE